MAEQRRKRIGQLPRFYIWSGSFARQAQQPMCARRSLFFFFFFQSSTTGVSRKRDTRLLPRPLITMEREANSFSL